MAPAMPAFSYAKAAAHLNDKDKERLAAYYLAVVDQVQMSGKIHRQVAADLNSTERTMVTSYSAMMVKLRKHDCQVEGGADEGSAAPKPKGKKRKAAAEYGEKEGEGVEGSVSKKVKNAKKDSVAAAADEEVCDEI